METAFTPRSRFPQMETTIFTVMSRLAAECGAVNLSQGFPDFQADPELFERAHHHMRAGRNQYAPMAGMPELRRAIADKVDTLYGRRYDAEDEITVTAGATQAIFTAVAALVGPGDEAIILEPAYDSYAPAIAAVGASVRRVRLCFPAYQPDWPAVQAAINARTRLIIVNSPHNPTGALLSSADLDTLAALLRGTDIAVLSDEVYEHIVFDGMRHQSLAAHPELAARSLVVSSFGKTYHITGWKIGYILGPAALMAEFRKVHQFNVFTVHTPAQLAIADYMQDARRHLGLAAFYEEKRDAFRQMLTSAPFRLLPCKGTYFQLADYTQCSKQADRDFAIWLARQVGVAAIPVSAFYHDGCDHRVVRFCFAKEEATLRAAADRLARLSACP